MTAWGNIAKRLAKPSLAASPLWFGLMIMVSLYATKAVQEWVQTLAIVQWHM